MGTGQGVGTAKIMSTIDFLLEQIFQISLMRLLYWPQLTRRVTSALLFRSHVRLYSRWHFRLIFCPSTIKFPVVHYLDCLKCAICAFYDGDHQYISDSGNVMELDYSYR